MEPTKKIKTDEQNHTIFNLENLIKFRQTMHTYPELGFKEVITQKAIKEYLLNIGVKEEQMTVCAQTGYYVDIYGKAQKSGTKKLIAIRTDIDALSMTEQNPDLPYKSQTNAAHACGHDGHTTTILGLTSLFYENIDRIPSDKGIRLLIQPSEEGPISGAKQMIKEGCLEGVDECYGYHNWPTHPVGYLLVKPGPMMASVSIIRINFYGKGGHGSAPQDAIDPVQMAVNFHMKFRNMTENTFKGRNFVSTLPVLKGGERFNVIANSSYIEGTLRSLEDGFPQIFEKQLQNILEQTKQEFPGSDYKLDFVLTYDQVTNTEKEAEHVERLGIQQFGKDKVGTFDCIPVKASEDFSFFIQKVPGCFFFLGSGRHMNDIMLHDCHYNFNDDLIVPASNFFWKLVQDRLEIQ